MTEPVTDDEPYLLVDEVAERLGLPVAVLLRRIETGDVMSRRVDDEDGFHYELRLGDLGIEMDPPDRREADAPEVVDDTAPAAWRGDPGAAPAAGHWREVEAAVAAAEAAAAAVAAAEPAARNRRAERAPDPEPSGDEEEAGTLDGGDPAWIQSSEVPDRPSWNLRREPQESGQPREPGEPTVPARSTRPLEPQQPPVWNMADDDETVHPASAVPGAQGILGEAISGDASDLERSLIDPLAGGPRHDLSSMSLDARELVAGLLDRWERTLEQRIYTEQRQRFQAELTARQTMVKQLQLELQTARAEHAAAQADKDRMLAEKERELADRERALDEARQAAEEVQRTIAAVAPRRRWFRARSDG